jgi:replicative DNA helicase
MADAWVKLRDEETEREVLASALVWGESFVSLQAAGCTADLFAKDAHILIWAGMERVFRAGTRPDVMALVADLKSANLMDRVGLAYLMTIDQRGPVKIVADRAAFLVAKLRELRQRRETFKWLRRLHETTVNEWDPSAAQREARQVLEALDGAAPDQTIYSQDMPTLVEREVKSQRPRLSLGFERLDDLMRPSAPQMVGVMARSGVGKTMLLCNAARSSSQQGWISVFFTLEMSAFEVIMRCASMALGQPREIIEASVARDVQDWGAFGQSYGNLLVNETVATMDDIEATVRRLRYEVPQTPIVCYLDYLGLVQGDPRLTTYERVSQHARDLKALSKRQNVVMAVAIQVSRGAGESGNVRLSLGAARDSGVVEEACDYLVGARRIEDNEDLENVIFVDLIKNRHGQKGRDEWGFRMNTSTLTLSYDPLARPPTQQRRQRSVSRPAGRQARPLQPAPLVESDD